MRSRGPLVAAAALAVVVAGSYGMAAGAQATLPAPQRPQPDLSVRDGVYTIAQAARGRTTFQDTCSWCHPDPLWRRSWPGQSVGDLYRFILRSMPDDNPGSLSAGEAADVLAYILDSNGLPAGPRELPADPEALSRILIVDPEETRSP